MSPKTLERCAACKSDTTERMRTITDGIDTTLCINFAQCCRSYRGDRTPSQYGRTLRLGVLL